MENNKEKYAFLSLRWGLALVILWSVWVKFTGPDKVVGMMKALGVGFASVGFVYVLGVILLILALSLIFNYKANWSGWALTAFFAVTVILGLTNGFSVGPALWKDIGLLGASLAIAFKE